jgi:hypothetical protein
MSINRTREIIMQTQKKYHKQKQALFWRRHVFVLQFFIAFAFLLIIPYLVCANAPSGMTVSYNLETQDLRVTITHPVSDPTTHYIFKVEIKKNGVMYNTSTYTSQPDPNSFTYVYKINATTNDTIDVTASCIQGGLKTIQYTVATNNAQSKKSAPGFEMIILIGATLITLAILRRKWIH